jgi:hypothetical protein
MRRVNPNRSDTRDELVASNLPERRSGEGWLARRKAETLHDRGGSVRPLGKVGASAEQDQRNGKYRTVN